MLSGSDDRTLRLWDIASGRSLRLFQGHRGSVVAIAELGDGRAASGGHDCQAR